MKVLIVDDSGTMRKIVARNLRKGKYSSAEVLEASDGAEALALLNENAVDLIFSDVNMPKMTGTELLDKLRADDELAKIPVIMITTEATPDSIRDFLARGAKACVAKPFSPDQLEEAVAGVIGG